MLGIEKTRELIGNDKNLSDEEILKIEETLYRLAEIALERYFENKKDLIKNKNSLKS